MHISNRENQQQNKNKSKHKTKRIRKLKGTTPGSSRTDTRQNAVPPLDFPDLKDWIPARSATVPRSGPSGRTIEWGSWAKFTFPVGQAAKAQEARIIAFDADSGRASPAALDLSAYLSACRTYSPPIRWPDCASRQPGGGREISSAFPASGSWEYRPGEGTDHDRHACRAGF